MSGPETPDGIYIEFTIQGNFAKATAIDAATGLEVSIMGPASAPRNILANNAVRKLEFMLKKKGGGV
ncbi:MAG TPA: hypothetical protein VIJ72_00865 [Rhizomicrobium sp.]